MMLHTQAAKTATLLDAKTTTLLEMNLHVGSAKPRAEAVKNRYTPRKSYASFAESRTATLLEMHLSSAKTATLPEKAMHPLQSQEPLHS
jgi:hypothetical protein